MPKMYYNETDDEKYNRSSVLSPYYITYESESESETETEPDPPVPEEICFPCYPRNHEWFVKIYNERREETKYISSYHARQLPNTVEDIFTNLILPTEEDGSTWIIADYENLYDINVIEEQDI